MCVFFYGYKFLVKGGYTSIYVRNARLTSPRRLLACFFLLFTYM